HAARAARAVRQPHQPRLGPCSAQEVLPGLQFRAAGGGDGGGRHPVARRVAFVRAAGGVPLPASQFCAGDAGAGSPRLADIRDTLEPSMLFHEILNSQVYTFLDDAPLEERRARAVYTRRATEVRSADDLGALDPAAIQRVREEAWPVANTADELYDALMVAGYLLDEEITPQWRELLRELGARALRKDGRWYAVERKDDAAQELQASRMEVLGPVAEKENSILLKLEGQGRILRGRFTPGTSELEWCDRRLLARIHRYTLSRLRSEIEPVTAAEFMRFLLHWQHVAAGEQLKGAEGLAAVVEQL